MATYLITGCAGFIGSHLCENLLNSNHKIIGIDNLDPFYDTRIKLNNLSIIKSNDNFRFIEGDISDTETYESIDEEIDTVIHLAAKAGVRPSIASPKAYLETNVFGTQTLLDWMVSNKINNIVFASSSSVYGNNTKVPFEESDNVDFPISPYAYTKKASELMLHTYHKLYNINTLCLRFFTVYGPRQRPDLAIHKFTRLIHNKQPIDMYGDGSTSRDYTYVDDIVSGILNSIEHLKSLDECYEIINIGNSSPITLTGLIDVVQKVIGKQAIINELPMQPGDVTRTYASINKAKELIDYSPNTKIEAGIQQFYDWFLSTQTETAEK